MYTQLQLMYEPARPLSLPQRDLLLSNLAYAPLGQMAGKYFTIFDKFL
jgi:hypothetical protein